MGKQLKTASWDLVPEVMEKLKPHWPETMISYFTLQVFYEWSRRTESRRGTFLLPDGDVDEFATFVLVYPDYRRTVFFNTCKSDTADLKQLLIDTPLIDWSESVTFGAFHERFKSMVEGILDTKKPTVERLPVECSMALILDKTIGKSLEIYCPDNVYVASLSDQQADFIHSVWPGKDRVGEKSLQAVKHIIKCNGGVGVFSKETKELLSWAVHSFTGCVGLLQTSEKHLQKGYGRIAATAITKLITEKDIDPIAIVLSHNNKSLNLFHSLGYKNHYNVYWIQSYS